VPIPLPNLDDLDWTQLTKEGRLLIPGVAPNWTNHNASDPGITLVELFAYFTEMFHYRLNRVSDANLIEFVRFLRGPDWRPGPELSAEIRETMAGIAEIHRAVTAADYEALALAVNDTFQSHDGECVARVRCIPSRNLELGTPTAGQQDAPGHVSLVVVPNRRAQPSIALVRAIRHSLEPARLLTTRVHVVGARFVTFSVRLTLVAKANVIGEKLQQDAIVAIERFFDPLTGGFDGQGWPFGRSIYVSEVYQLLDKLAGVDYIVKTRNPITGDEWDELVTDASQSGRLRRNGAGDLEAVAIEPQELVVPWIDRSDIVVETL
jgi:hypothetical protein